MALAKAFIQSLDETGAPTGSPVNVLFNPSEYTIEKSNQFQNTVIPGLSAPLTHFISGNAQTLTLDLFFDTYEAGEDVRKYTSKITAFLDIDEKLHAPPVCLFFWGKLSFKSVIEKISQKFTMFLDTGIPVRATLGVTFKEYRTLTEQFQKANKDNFGGTKMSSVHSDEKIWQIAQRELGDASRWREIARANHIVNPRALKPGMNLVIPK